MGRRSHSSGCRLKWNICLADFLRLCLHLCFFFSLSFSRVGSALLLYCFCTVYFARDSLCHLWCTPEIHIYICRSCWFFVFVFRWHSRIATERKQCAHSTQPLIIGNLVWLINTESQPRSFVIHHLWRRRTTRASIVYGASEVWKARVRYGTWFWWYKNDLYWP